MAGELFSEQFLVLLCAGEVTAGGNGDSARDWRTAGKQGFERISACC